MKSDAISDQLAHQAKMQDQLSEQIEILKKQISDQQGFINEEVFKNSGVLNTVRTVLSFGSHEIFQYVHLLNIARRTENYLKTFSESSPRISVIITTHTNPTALWERTIPSIVNQTHSNLEILIMVDGNNPDIFPKTLEAATQFGDARVSVNLASTTPTEFPELADLPLEIQTQFSWFCSGNGPFNCGLDTATGEWIAPFSHDDVMHKDGYERVLAKAREMKWEYCYAPIVRLSPTESSIIHSFPPRSHNFGVQGSLIHASLNMFRYDYRDALIGLPNDYGMVRRMMLCGVRMGTINEAASDYYPSSLWN